jgi:hypothetical protein
VQQLQPAPGDPRAALKKAGITQKALKGYAQGNGERTCARRCARLGSA